MRMLITMLPLVLLIVIMYFMLIRPQKKREREVNLMRSNLHVGDDIITIGGICGKIVRTKEDTIIIQVGADKLKFEMMRWSVSKVVDTVEKKDIRVRDDADETDEAEEETTKARPQRLQKAEPVAEPEAEVEEEIETEEAEAEETAEKEVEETSEEISKEETEE